MVIDDGIPYQHKGHPPAVAVSMPWLSEKKGNFLGNIFLGNKINTAHMPKSEAEKRAKVFLDCLDLQHK